MSIWWQQTVKYINTYLNIYTISIYLLLIYRYISYLPSVLIISKIYNLRGSDEDVSPSVRTTRRNEYDGDLTPEEIFSMFFGFPGGVRQRRSTGIER